MAPCEKRNRDKEKRKQERDACRAEHDGDDGQYESAGDGESRS
jgi:hypothetical protein